MEQGNRFFQKIKQRKFIIVIMTAIVALLVVAGIVIWLILWNKGDGNLPSEPVDKSESGYVETTVLPEDFIGYWHLEYTGELELAIESIEDGKVDFYYWSYPSDPLSMVAELNGSVADFSYDQDGLALKGYLTFNVGSIVLDITESNDEINFPVVTYAFKQRSQRSWVQLYTDSNGMFESGLESYPYGSYYDDYGQYPYDYDFSDGTDGQQEGYSEYFHSSENSEEEYEIPSTSTSRPNTTSTSNSNITENPPAATSSQTGSQESNSPPQPVVTSVQVKNVTFNYVKSYEYVSPYSGLLIDYDIQLDIKYCEPSEYMTGNDPIVSNYSWTGLYPKEKIGSLYRSAGTDNFAVFEITVSGNYVDKFLDSYKNIEFRQYTSGGTLLINPAGITDHELVLIERNPGAIEGSIQQTFYMGFYTSEVGRVDFKILDIGPNGIGQW